MIERSIPRVSDVLRQIDDSYEHVPEELLAAASARGEVLHQYATAYFASQLGDCDEPKLEEIPTEYRKAYQGVLKWAKDNQVVPVLVEQRSTNEVYGFTGQPDLLAYVGPKRIFTLIDLKFTAMILAINKVQLRAYKELPMYQEAQAMEIVKVNWGTGLVKSQPVYLHGTNDWGAFLIGLKKLRLLEEVEECDEQLETWREAA